MAGPVFKLKGKHARGLAVAVWESRNGGHYLTWEKSYRDKQVTDPQAKGAWKSTGIYFPEEVKEHIDMLNQALEWINNPDIRGIEKREAPHTPTRVTPSDIPYFQALSNEDDDIQF